MRNLILAAALALVVLSPLTAAAQQRSAPSPAAPATIEGVSSAKVLAIGFGAILGAVAANALVVGEGVTLIGGIAGGVAASWWYDNSSSSATRAAMRERTGGPAMANAERLAMAR